MFAFTAMDNSLRAAKCAAARCLLSSASRSLCAAACLWCIGTLSAFASSPVPSVALDCAHTPSLRLLLPAASSELALDIPPDLPTHAVLEVREAGQDLIIDSDAPRRAIQAPPRYGVTVFRVQHPMHLAIKRLRPGNAAGSVELIARCDPSSADTQWQWFGSASELSARLDGGVGSLRDDFPDALLAAVKNGAIDARPRALTAHLHAQALLLAGRAADASVAFERAAQAWQAIDDPERASAARVGVAEDLNRSGQYERVLSLARAANAAPDGSHYFGVRLENARCLALHYLHQLDQATACYAWTTSRLDALDETLELASTGIDYAAVEQARGQADAARRLLLDSLALAQGAQALTVQGRAHFALAGLARDQGDVGEAMHRLQQAQERFSAASDPRWQANALLRLAALLSELRAPGDARAAIERALSLLDARHAPARVAAARLLLAQIALSDGQPEAGLREVDAALRVYRELDMPEERVRAGLVRAALLLRAGRHDEARVAVGAEADDPPRQPSIDVAQRGLIRAELALQSGQPAKARSVLRDISAHLSWRERLERDHLLALIEFRSGRADRAHAALRARANALTALARAAGNPLLAHVLRASIDTLRQSAIDLIASSLDAGSIDQAQAVAHLTPWLLEPEVAAGNNAANRGPSSPALDMALAEMMLADRTRTAVVETDANALPAALLERLSRRGAGVAIATPPERALSPDALRALAQPGRPLLALLQGRTRLLRLWIDDGGDPRIDSLASGTVVRHLALLRGQLARPDGELAQIDDHVRTLSAAVFSGLGGRPAPARLQVIDQRLASAIPWPLLHWPDDDQPLLERSGVSLLRPVVADTPRGAPSQRIEVLVAAQGGATTVDALQTLATAAIEPALIAGIFPDQRVASRAIASREHLLTRLAAPGARLHLSAHGQTQSDRLVASGLWLSANADGGDPQFLSWADLFEQGVAADLVVLNACELAKGDSAASAALDFASAISRAGAHHTIAAQWPVSDTASAVWVPAFYRALAAGAEPADALAQARRALRASRAFRHPFHWAGWVHLQRVGVGT